MKKAIVLLSGGLDSSTTLAIAKSMGYSLNCLSFSYGQKQSAELKQAIKIKDFLAKEAEHIIISIDNKFFQKSSLVNKNLNIPNKNYSAKNIPNTYVPARNTIFLSYALAYSELIGSNDIFIGANELDYSGYPDCRPEYISAFTKMANLATAKNIIDKNLKIHAPLLNLKKHEIIKKGLELGVDYSKTLSCYNPNEKSESCGKCDACIFRLNGFKELNMKDPIKYAYE